MKATVDVPDGLYRRVKARSALEGRSVRDVTVQLFERWLAESPVVTGLTGDERSDAAKAWLRRWDAIGKRIGDSGKGDPTTREILIAGRDK
jgi:hypothetical protein